MVFSVHPIFSLFSNVICVCRNQFLAIKHLHHRQQQMVPLYSLYIPIDMTDICYNWLLWAMVVIVLCISFHFCYVITRKYLSQLFLFGRKILIPQTLTIRYAVFFVHFWFHCFFYFESNQIDQSDNNNNNNNNNNNLTISSSIDERIVKSDHPLCFANNHRTTLNTLFLLLPWFFLLWLI